MTKQNNIIDEARELGATMLDGGNYVDALTISMLIEYAEQLQIMNDSKGRELTRYQDSNAALAKEVKDLKSQLEQQNEWVSVDKGKLPITNQPVFYYFEDCGVFEGKYIGFVDGLHCFGGADGWLCGDVTHWMPRELPKPPEDK